MVGVKKIADFEGRFFKIVQEKSGQLLKGDPQKELESERDFPVSLTVDFSLLIGEINALAQARTLFEGIAEELKSDFNYLFKSKTYEDFIANFKALVEIEQLENLPRVLRSVIHMEVGLALSFITVINNCKNLQVKDYEDSFNYYFFTESGYKTVSGDLIIRPKFPRAGSLMGGERTSNQINAERYIRDLTRIMVETTGDKLYNLKERYERFASRYQDASKKSWWTGLIHSGIWPKHPYFQ